MGTESDGYVGRAVRGAVAAWLLLAMAAGWVRAAPLPPDPAGMTIAIYTYHLDRGKLVPSTMFTGIVLSPRHVVTSTEALMHGHEQLAGGGGVPAEVYGVVNAGGRQIILALTPTAMNVKSPVALLEVAEQDRDVTAAIIRKPPVAKALDEAIEEGTAVGVVGPFGAYPQQLAKLTVPRPIALSTTLGKRLSIAEGKVVAALVTHTLPSQFAGAGLWDAEDRLIGVLVRYDGIWHVVDPVSSAKLMAETDSSGPVMTDVTLPKPITPKNPEPAPAPKPEPEPEPPTPTPAPDKPEPDKPKPAEPGMRKELAGLFEMMHQQGLKSVVDPSLLDYVKQEQADLAMSYIAAGQYNKALDLVRDIEPLASGKLAEQLNYRAALALVLTGQYEKATARIAAAARAADSLVQIRGQLLHEVMQENPRGTFHGQALSQVDVLGRACKAVLARRRHTMDITFDGIKAYQLTSNADYDRLSERLNALAADVELNQKAWPGYFDALEQAIAAMRDKAVQNEYERVFRGLRDEYTAYSLAKEEAEYKSGDGWARPGYWPSDKVAAANVHADQFNAMLKRFGELDPQVPRSTRRTLPETQQKPVERLTQARPQ